MQVLDSSRLGKSWLRASFHGSVKGEYKVLGEVCLAERRAWIRNKAIYPSVLTRMHVVAALDFYGAMRSRTYDNQVKKVSVGS